MYKDRNNQLSVRFSGYQPSTLSTETEDLPETNNLNLMFHNTQDPISVLRQLGRHLQLVQRNKIKQASSTTETYNLMNTTEKLHSFF